MKAKTLWKRAFALALTVVMLVSCWVFSAPTAEVASAEEAGTYQVYVKFEVTDTADSWFGDGYGSGYTYESKTDGDRVGITIMHRNNNGYGSTLSYADYDLYPSSGTKPIKTAGTYNFTFDNIGFPVSIYAYNDHGNLADGTNYKITEVKVRKNGSGTYTELFMGDLVAGASNTGIKYCQLDYDGTVSNDGGSCTPSSDTYKNWKSKMPYVKTGGTISCPDVQLLASDDTASSTVSIASASDQYSVTYATANCTLTQGGSTSYFSISGTTFTAKKSCHKSADNVNSQTVTITATWAGSSEVTRTCNATILDEWYTATWYYTTTNTSNLASPTTTNYKTTTQQYGEYWKDAQPTDIPVNYYHTASKHYTNGTYGTVSGWAQNNTKTYTMTYTENDHGWSYSKLASSNANYATKHKITCTETTCAYSTTQAHSSAADAAVAPTCTETGLTAGTHCSLCEQVLTAQATVEELGHSWVEHETSAADGGAGIKYFTCNREGCASSEKYFGATYNTDTHTYTADTANEQSSVAAVEANTSTENMMAPAPAFNNFTVTYTSGSVQGDFPYASRLSQLKLENDNAVYVDTATTQALRFAGAVSVPAGVSLAVGSTEITDNVVLDFGFVYTQDRYISGADKLVIGGTTDIASASGKYYDIAKYSVKDSNSANGVFNGSNWSGVTQRGTTDNYSLTFNLLIPVYARNWNYAYAARPYITYKYHGVTYTVYDQGTTIGATGRTYSCASVAYIATHVVANSQEPLATRNYIQTKIVDHLADLPGYVVNPAK